MANEENPDADKASWTVKSVPVETRKLAVACATKQGETMAEWLGRAVRNQANLEAGERILPPLPRQTASLPVPVLGSAGPVDLEVLADLMQAAQAVAAAADVAIPKATARHALALVTAQLRAARGLPPKTRRQTSPENGQTIEAQGTGLPETTERQTKPQNGQTIERPS